ncbi:COG4223 family protein [Roseobacter sp. HKCCA0434]|uniref:COG4223 family protein n=1 Tax=Roseobacter sp. HKCCA0434 TaxID=3079297 RepID=UPI00290593D8|nr:mitofilin family membrane protein [Roseobacter sp. HKCCA0434]
MSDPKRPDDTPETEAETGPVAERDRDDSAGEVEDAEIVREDDAAAEDADRPDRLDDADDETLSDEVIAEESGTADDGDVRTEGDDADAVSDDDMVDDAALTDGAEADDTTPAVTPWGGAPADINARSTSDPASPAYVPPETGAEPVYVDDEYHEETPSVAARILFWLFLLVLGGVLVLWAGPRIAPNLPSGLSPVAEWLMPGQRAATLQIEELEERLNDRIAELDTGLTPDGVTADIDAQIAQSEARVADQTTDLTDRINALSDQVAAADSAQIEERLGQVETRLEGLTAEMSALRDDLTGLAAGDGGITGQNAQEIDAFTAALAGLQAELDTLAAQNGALNQRLDEVAATAERRLMTARQEMEAAEAQARAEVARASERAGMVALQNALATGEPFEEALSTLEGEAEIPEPLPALAPEGVPTEAELQTSFPERAHAAIRADLSPEESDGVFGSAGAFLRSRLAGRSLTEREGDDADAVLSRVEARLDEGDLDAALSEAETLGEAPRAEMEAWLDELRTRRDALAAYDELAERLAGTNE